MLDLHIAFAIVAIASIALWRVGMLAATCLPNRILMPVLVLFLGLLVWFVRSDSDRLWMAHLLPFSNLIILGNLTVPGVALLGGASFVKTPGSAARRCVLIVPLLALAGYDLVSPLLGSHPPLGDTWKNGVCRQTTSFSCGPAAAATLLKAGGIASTESEMAVLCLTHRDGTPTAGIYRGLKIKTAGQHVGVEPFHCDVDQLKKSLDLPVLLTVGLVKGATTDPRYEKKWGWAPGVRHTIVLFQFLPNNRVQVGDPDTGREVWSIESLRVLWQGDGIRLTRK